MSMHLEPAPIAASTATVVCDVIATCLGKTPGSVRLEHNLVDDLGAESLDFLDIVFELEQRFGIEITRGALERAARGDMAEEEFAPGGILSEPGLARLRELLPESAERIVPGLRARQIPGLFTAATFARIVATKLGAEPEAGR